MRSAFQFHTPGGKRTLPQLLEVLVCQRDGCKAKPTHYLVLHVPPPGMEPDMGLELTLAATWCAEHAKEETPAGHVRFWLPSLQATAAQRGLIALDLPRATLDVRPLGDEHWLAFIRAAVMARGGGTA